ncbi:MAG: CTP synthase [Endomicrobiia bacterium]|nr:CTP synthase [Endomicrobiia bacterium]
MKNKILVVTGGVVSSLGKGITSASLALLMKQRGFKTDVIKCDPYINIDPGTMSPYQHGEVFVTDDGAETDLDLGHYERFLGAGMTRLNNITAGQIYQTVIARERKGDYLGKTVQVIPHITDEIKRRIALVASRSDITVVEIGGTVGDIEGLPFLEAARQLRSDYGRQNVVYVHLTLVPTLSPSQDIKTKPTQHSVMKLREIGIDPDIIICRSESALPADVRAKLSLFCGVPRECVIGEPNVARSIYEVPLVLHAQNTDDIILEAFGVKHPRRPSLDKWKSIIPRKYPACVTIGIAGKYTQVKDAYKSIFEALHHAAQGNKVNIRIKYIDTETSSAVRDFGGCDGVLVPGGFGDRGIEGKILAARYARVSGKPYFGICLGMQAAVIEFARSVVGLRGAHSGEFDSKTPHPVIDYIEGQKDIRQKGATMRLGAYTCALAPIKSVSRACYRAASVRERHRHRLEFNNSYKKLFEEKGMIFAGVNPEKRLVEIIEIKKHPWFVGVQFHPEFRSTPLAPHPLFVGFIAAAKKRVSL